MKKPEISHIEQFVINKVKEKRIKLDLTQADLADELKMSKGFIGNVESPKYRAKYSLEHLNKLAKIFKCSPKDFLPKDAF